MKRMTLGGKACRTVCAFFFLPMAAGHASPGLGGYVGAKAGATNHGHSCAADALECDRKDTGYGLLGGYDFSRRFGVEFSLADIGESSAIYSDVTLEGALSVADLSAKYAHRLYGNSQIFAKLGVAYWRGDVTGWDVDLDDSGFRPTVGFGVAMPFSRHFSARIEYQYFDDLGNREMGHTNPHFLNLGISWHFASSDGYAAEYESGVTTEPTPRAPAQQPLPGPTSSDAKFTPGTEQKTESPADSAIPRPTESMTAETDSSGSGSTAPIVVDDQVGRPLFLADSAVLEDARALEFVAIRLMREPSLVVRIVAHTDNRGDIVTNLQLSQRRARTVGEYLQWQGVAPERITTVGEGEDSPVADNNTPAGRARNRRVEFFFTDTKNRR